MVHIGLRSKIETTRTVLWRTVVAFYNNQMTHHAAALTYYGLLTFFPTLLLGLSLLGLLGQYPETYDAILDYLQDVAPEATLGAIDATLRNALENKDTAALTLTIGIVVVFYGTTGVLEASRRAMNVAFEVGSGRSFVRRKLTDIVSSLVLAILVLITLILMFLGGDFAEETFGLIGLGSTAEQIWSIARWPAALLTAMLAFGWLYYVTPDVKQRSFRWITPGAIVGVLGWIAVSVAFSFYLSSLGDFSAYGSFAAALVLIFWLWLTNVSILFGAQLNAEIERERELAEGVPPAATLALPDRG